MFHYIGEYFARLHHQAEQRRFDEPVRFWTMLKSTIPISELIAAHQTLRAVPGILCMGAVVLENASGETFIHGANGSYLVTQHGTYHFLARTVEFEVRRGDYESVLHGVVGTGLVETVRFGRISMSADEAARVIGFVSAGGVKLGWQRRLRGLRAMLGGA